MKKQTSLIGAFLVVILIIGIIGVTIILFSGEVDNDFVINKETKEGITKEETTEIFEINLPIEDGEIYFSGKSNRDKGWKNFSFY